MLELITLLFALNTLGLGEDSCESPEQLLHASRSLEDSTRELKQENGFLFSERGQSFKALNQRCFMPFMNSSEHKLDSKNKHILFNAVQKSYFYTRDKSLLELYVQYLNKPNNDYEPALKFSQSEMAHFSFEGVEGKKYLSHDGKIKELDKTNAILIVSSPFCGFSQNLRSWIQTQAKIKNLNITWGVKPPVGLSEDDFFNHPDFSGYDILLNLNSWSDIPLWSTPVLYHYINGKIEKQVVGFNEEMKEYLSQVAAK